MAFGKRLTVLCRLTTASDILIGCCSNCDHYDEAAALQDYMFQHVCRNGSMQHDPDLSDALPKLLLHVLYTLSKYADCTDPWKPGQPITLPISSVEVLTKLMRSFETESFPGKLTVLSQWFSNTIASPSFSMHTERFSELMEHATRVLRATEETVSNSCLDQLAVRLCQHAGTMPPIAAIDHSNTQQLADAMNILSNISDMYIVTESYHGFLNWNLPADREPGGASTSAERKALLALTIKQVQGEGSVARAAAASRRAEPSSDASASADHAARYVSCEAVFMQPRTCIMQRRLKTVP